MKKMNYLVKKLSKIKKNELKIYLKIRYFSKNKNENINYNIII